jgi:hypothetical protein
MIKVKTLTAHLKVRPFKTIELNGAPFGFAQGRLLRLRSGPKKIPTQAKEAWVGHPQGDGLDPAPIYGAK